MKKILTGPLPGALAGGIALLLGAPALAQGSCEGAETIGPSPVRELPRTVLPEALRLDRAGERSVAGSAEEGWSLIELAEVLPAFFPKRMHSLHQVDITFPDGPGGDEALASAYFHNPMPMDDGNGGEKVVEFGGLYHHTFLRTPDGWRSRKLHEEIVRGTLAELERWAGAREIRGEITLVIAGRSRRASEGTAPEFRARAKDMFERLLAEGLSPEEAARRTREVFG